MSALPIPPAQPVSPSAPNRVGVRIIALGVLITLLYFGKMFFVTLISAVVISFILEPFVALFMRLRMPRGVASFVTCSLALGGLYVVSLGAYTQALRLVEDLPAYVKRVNELTDSIADRIEGVERTLNELLPRRMQERGATQPQTPSPVASRKRRAAVPPVIPVQPPAVQEVRIAQERSGLVGFLYEWLGRVYELLLMASFVPFLVYFMLSWRDHIRRTFLQLFHGDGRIEVSSSLSGIASLTRAYMAGNFVLGMILTLVSMTLFLAMRLPYALLVAPVSGFLSLVPYVGLPLAVLPPILAALPVYSTLPQYLILATGVAFLHLIALNLLYPKVVGGRVHLNPLAVTIALMFWGLIWDGAGLVLAIPITAGIKAVCDNVSGLESYGRLLGD